MYKNGYYVEKDIDKYKKIIEGLYEQLRYTNNVQDHLPEVCLRLAGIRKDEGDTEEALRLISEGRSMIASRFGFDPFFGNFNIMRSFVQLQYRISEFDISRCDIYYIYYLFEKPCVDRIISTDPYQYIRILESEELTAMKKEELEKELAEFTRYENELKDILKNLMMNGADITWETN